CRGYQRSTDVEVCVCRVALSGSGLTCRWKGSCVWLADEVVTEIGFVAERISNRRSSPLGVITEVRHVAEIVGNSERLTDLSRLSVTAIRRVVQRDCDLSRCVVARSRGNQNVP